MQPTTFNYISITYVVELNQYLKKLNDCRIKYMKPISYIVLYLVNILYTTQTRRWVAQHMRIKTKIK